MTDGELAGFLWLTIEKELPGLRSLTPEQASTPRGGPGSWSPKQELGHLIDSASNNHMRFARAALDGAYAGPGYEQNGWVELHGYQDLPWETLVEFWLRYNELLAALIERIPAAAFDVECRIGSDLPKTLRYVVTSYILHIQHHVDQILKRPEITQY
jgi:hypothetical protein